MSFCESAAEERLPQRERSEKCDNCNEPSRSHPQQYTPLDATWWNYCVIQLFSRSQESDPAVLGNCVCYSMSLAKLTQIALFRVLSCHSCSWSKLLLTTWLPRSIRHMAAMDCCFPNHGNHGRVVFEVRKSSNRKIESQFGLLNCLPLSDPVSCLIPLCSWIMLYFQLETCNTAFYHLHRLAKQIRSWREEDPPSRCRPGVRPSTPPTPWVPRCPLGIPRYF